MTRYQFFSIKQIDEGTKKSRPRISFYGDWLDEIGFVPNALVQVLPESDGSIVFNLYNENFKYSDLYTSTKKQSGTLVRVNPPRAWERLGTHFVTSGRHVSAVGLSAGDLIIAKYDYGFIRVKKIGVDFPNARLVNATSVNRKNTEKVVPRVRLCGKWLAEAGFKTDAVATASSEQGSITLTLRGEGEKYADLVRLARQSKMSLIQVRSVKGLPIIAVSDSCIDKAGFQSGDTLAAAYDYGVIKLQKLDLEKLGF